MRKLGKLRAANVSIQHKSPLWLMSFSELAVSIAVHSPLHVCSTFGRNISDEYRYSVCLHSLTTALILPGWFSSTRQSLGKLCFFFAAIILSNISPFVWFLTNRDAAEFLWVCLVFTEIVQFWSSMEIRGRPRPGWCSRLSLFHMFDSARYTLTTTTGNRC